jgi:ArsR family transcriptional regulator
MRNDFRELAAVSRALGDETRLRILNLLVERGETCVCELMETLGTTQSNMSFHLNVLKNARLITDKKLGKWMFYRIDLEALNRQIANLRELFNGKRLGAARPVTSIFALCCQESAMPLSRKHARQAVKQLRAMKKATRARSAK